MGRNRPLVLRQVSGQEIVAFRADDQGRITYMFQGNLPINGYSKLAWYESLAVQYGLLIGCMLLFLSTLMFALIGWLATRRKGDPQPRQAMRAHWLAWGTSALYLLFLILFVIGIFDLTITPLVKAALVVALVAAGLTAGLVARPILVWRRRYWSVVGRAHYSLLALGAVAFVWFLNYWNLLGFRL